MHANNDLAAFSFLQKPIRDFRVEPERFQLPFNCSRVDSAFPKLAENPRRCEGQRR